MSKKLRIGDVVKLNSGSPNLTVLRIFESQVCDSEGFKADVAWVGKSGEEEVATFPVVCLRKIRKLKG
jgi:hypothetical protein